jgi:ppGpp synthetase/RelA/SpoT-type nucleotidyltranferase
MVFSKKDFAALCMRRDLTIEQYDDPIHDLIGISLTMRFGTDVLNEKAGAAIYHK